jgi:hypothetical protein
MAVKTDLQFECYEYRLSDIATEFRIEASIQNAGELPQTMIFVYEIITDADPAADVFNRVASPRDLRELEISRALAIAAGATEYLSNTVTLSYPLLDVAVAAKAALSSRISECINAWVTYRDSFMDDGTVLHPFPTVDASYEQGLKDAYTDAKAYRVTKETAATAAATALTLAEADAANAAALLAIYTVETDFCTKDRVNTWVPLKSSVSTFTSTTQTQMTNEKGTFMLLAAIGHAWPPTGPEIAGLTANLLALYNEIVAISNAVDSYNNVGAPLATTLDIDFLAFCSGAATNRTAAVTTKAAKDTAAANAATAKEEADAELASALIAEAAALAAVKAVCPDYDPNA